MEEENEIEEQSGRPIQRPIPQSQRGKAKTTIAEKDLSTASFPFIFFIQEVRKPRVCMSCVVSLGLPEVTLISDRFVTSKMKITKLQL